MDDRKILIGGDYSNPLISSYSFNCADCNQTIYISIENVKLIEGEGFEPSCFDCAKMEIAMGDEVPTLKITEETRQKLIEVTGMTEEEFDSFVAKAMQEMF